MAILQILVRLGASGILAKVAEGKVVGRLEVCENQSLIAPVVQHMGPLVASNVRLASTYV